MRLEAHSVQSACSMAAACLGVTLVNEMMAHDYAHMPVVIRRLKQNITHYFALTLPADIPLADAAQIFLDTTVTFLKRHFTTLQTGQHIERGRSPETSIIS